MVLDPLGGRVEERTGEVGVPVGAQPTAAPKVNQLHLVRVRVDDDVLVLYISDQNSARLVRSVA